MLLLLLGCLPLWGRVSASPFQQQPISDVNLDSPLKVQAELKKAEIIPTVIDDFLPSLSLSVSWKKDDAELGNTIKPKKLQSQPSISLFDETTSKTSTTSSMNYVITLTDPDAPSRDNPKWSEMCHWIAANVSLSSKTFSDLPSSAVDVIEDEERQESNNPDDVIEYKPPGPPEKTGKHRYVFLVFAPSNGTSQPLNLTKPKDRQHWGTGEERGGVRDWAKENDLVPVAANFIYSQHKKQ